MNIEMSPIDTLFFRDAKSFTMIEDNWAEGIFPPTPLTIYGALRAEYFSNHLNDFPKRETNEDPSLNSRINGIFLSKGDEIFVPLPNDIVILKDSEKPTIKNLKLIAVSNQKSVLSSYDYPYILKAEKNIENIPDGWIKIEDLLSYLKNGSIEGNFNIEPQKPNEIESSTNYSIIRLSNYLINEPKIGIKISKKTGTAKEQYLYSLTKKRLKDINLIINFEGLNFPREGVLKLGGRNGKVHFKKLEENNIKSKQIKKFLEFKKKHLEYLMNNLEENKDVFIKIYFATPTIFHKIYHPNFQNSLQSEFKVIACALGKPLYIGGFNMKEGYPRPMYKALNSGSLYYLKSNKKFINQISTNTNLSDQWEERGFGIFSIGQTKTS
jgi:CRISPR-associated protein Cmr3